MPFTILPAPLRETAIAFSFLEHESYGVRLTRDFAFFINCGPEQMLLALDQHWLEGGVAAIGTRPLLLGVVGQRAQVDGSYSAAWLLLSWPQDATRVCLAVHRPSGPQVLFGSVAINSNGLGFGLRSVRTPGAVPIELEGRIAGSKLEVMIALSGRRRITRRSPVPMEPSPSELSR